VFLNLFKAEPFVAILIAHGTHVFWGDSCGQKGGSSRQKAESRGEVLAPSRGKEPLPHQLRHLGSAESSPSGVQGRAPTVNIF